MRLIDVILASALLGLALGYFNMDSPDVAKASVSGAASVAASECGQSACQRLTWLRTPAMRRTTYTE